MALKAERIDVWTTEIPDEPGGLDGILEPLAEAGVDLDFLVARRQSDQVGKGIVFLSGIEGAAQARVARKAGLAKAKASELAAVRVEGTNKAGAARQITRMLAEAGINLRGMTASVLGRRFVAKLAFDSGGDASKAVRVVNQQQSTSKRKAKG